MDRPIIIVAELGINHNGDMQLAKEMINEAKSAGADIAKFQLYDPEVLLRNHKPRDDLSEEERLNMASEMHQAGYVFSYEEWDAILASRLTRRQMYFLQEECRRAELEILFSVFDEERLSWTEEIGVKRYKIASRTFKENPSLCRKIADLGKPIIASDGYVRTGNITPKYLSKAVQWLYCVSMYPAPLEKIEFPKFNTYDGSGKWYVGFSDHTIGTAASVMAMSLGAKIVEKHFTLDRTLPGPDHILSADPEDLAEICRFRDDIEKILWQKST